MCPLVQQFVLSVLCFHGWQGSWGSKSKKFARRGHEANASPGTEPEAPGRRLRFGHQQHPKPENRDSQHMLNQHRGSFSDFLGSREKYRCLASKGSALLEFLALRVNIKPSRQLRWHVCRANFGTKYFVGATNVLTKKALKFSSRFLNLICGSKIHLAKFCEIFHRLSL